jgi:diguanylate cyclase (GGDEF)-like protein
MERAAYSRSVELSAPAAAFEFVVVWATVAGAVAFGLPERVTAGEWVAFAVLVPLIAAGHLISRERDKHQGSQLSLAPMFAAVLLLPPLLAAAAIALAFIPEWVRTRVSWYIVLFNVANLVGPALVARAVYDAVSSTGSGMPALAAVAAVVAFLAVQYAVLGTMLRLARDVPFRDTVRLDCVVIDAALLSLGAVGALLAEQHASLVVLLALPLALAYRALDIPSLVEASRIEPKTGLFNVRHFEAALEQELARAGRFKRPVSLLMIDVDHLRHVNEARGHLAGDKALRLVTQELRRATRDYDVPARWGGDEFCLLLPETTHVGALAVAERIRAGVERAGGEDGTGLTVSIGVASIPWRGVAPEELLSRADAAAYLAKFSGRNAVALPPDGDPVGEAERALAEAVEGD